MPPHQKHTTQQLEELREELLLKLPDVYINTEKSINELIDSCVADLQQLKIRHNKYISKYVSSHQRFEHLRRKLLIG
jgi:hypothetical protein